MANKVIAQVIKADKEYKTGTPLLQRCSLPLWNCVPGSLRLY